MSDRQRFIDEYFDGDDEAYENNRKYGDQSTIDWSDIAVSAKCFPEREAYALAWIETALGYLPDPSVYMPYLGFMQTLIANSEGGIVSDEVFFNELLTQLQNIRNDDIKKGGWLEQRVYDEHLHEEYRTYLSIYKQPAQERLIRTLGYEPELEYSLTAELYLRQLFEFDDFYFDMPVCNMDIKAATITLYREAFLKEGEAYADELDLSGLNYKDVKQVVKAT